MSCRVLVQASHSTPGQQVLDRLQSVSPVQLDGEVVVLSFMFVFPAVLFLAGRILIWDYKVCCSCLTRCVSHVLVIVRGCHS